MKRSTVRTVRMKSGFYVTLDAQWRIIRRKFLAGKVTVWHTEKWNEADRQYIITNSFQSLAAARTYLDEVIDNETKAKSWQSSIG